MFLFYLLRQLGFINHVKYLATMFYIISKHQNVSLSINKALVIGQGVLMDAILIYCVKCTERLIWHVFSTVEKAIIATTFLSVLPPVTFRGQKRSANSSPNTMVKTPWSICDVIVECVRIDYLLYRCYSLTIYTGIGYSNVNSSSTYLNQ